MSRTTSFAFGLALPLAFVSQTALADLTPAQVWGDWKQYLEGFGYQVEATESTSGGNLIVSDMNMSFAMPDNGGEMTMSVGTITFQQNGDGSVAIVMPETMPINVVGTGIVPGQDMNMAMTYIQTGHSMTASGSPDNLTYLYTADTIQMDMNQQVKTPDGDTSTNMTFTGNGVENTTTMTIGDLRGYAQTSSIANAAYQLVVNMQEEGEKATINGTMSGVTIVGEGQMPLSLPKDVDMVTMLESGFDIAGQIAYASGSADIAGENPRDGNFSMQTSSQGGALDVAIGAGGLAYSGAQKDLKMAVTVATMPFPIELAMAESGFNLMMPVKKADDAQDFAFGITLGDFTMSDLLWGIFDGAGQLPRDPATIKLDLSGKAKVLVDYMIPQHTSNIPAPQASVETLNLNTLVVDAVGAKLEGSGALTMNNDGPALIPGMGTPVGALTFALAGGNGLLDKLTAMGLLPQEQAMGARMMMGIFAVPGSTPDTLNSKIEFTQDGQILANGQRIR